MCVAGCSVGEWVGVHTYVHRDRKKQTDSLAVPPQDQVYVM